MEGQRDRDAGGITKYPVRQPEGETCCICVFQVRGLKCSLGR